MTGKAAELVGTMHRGFVIEAYNPGVKVQGGRITQTLSLRCPEGHVFKRNAWDILKGRNVRCFDCEPTYARKAVAKQDEYEPEVCNCTYFNGVLKRACRQHRSAA